MKTDLKAVLADVPIIAAVKNDGDLTAALQKDNGILFVLYGDVITIPGIVKQIKEQGRIALVHVDLIQGLSSRDVAVDFIREYTEADGIISTRATAIRRARELGLCTVMRFFVLDSMAYAGIRDQILQTKPDVIEILPGLMPKVICKVAGMTRRPVIAGGLITDKEDVMAALDAGATAVSSTNHDVWGM